MKARWMVTSTARLLAELVLCVAFAALLFGSVLLAASVVEAQGDSWPTVTPWPSFTPYVPTAISYTPTPLPVLPSCPVLPDGEALPEVDDVTGRYAVQCAHCLAGYGVRTPVPTNPYALVKPPTVGPVGTEEGVEAVYFLSGNIIEAGFGGTWTEAAGGWDLNQGLATNYSPDGGAWWAEYIAVPAQAYDVVGFLVEASAEYEPASNPVPVCKLAAGALGGAAAWPTGGLLPLLDAAYFSPGGVGRQGYGPAGAQSIIPGVVDYSILETFDVPAGRPFNAVLAAGNADVPCQPGVSWLIRSIKLIFYGVPEWAGETPTPEATQEPTQVPQRGVYVYWSHGMHAQGTAPQHYPHVTVVNYHIRPGLSIGALINMTTTGSVKPMNGSPVPDGATLTHWADTSFNLTSSAKSNGWTLVLPDHNSGALQSAIGQTPAEVQAIVEQQLGRPVDQVIYFAGHHGGSRVIPADAVGYIRYGFNWTDASEAARAYDFTVYPIYADALPDDGLEPTPTPMPTGTPWGVLPTPGAGLGAVDCSTYEYRDKTPVVELEQEEDWIVPGECYGVVPGFFVDVPAIGPLGFDGLEFYIPRLEVCAQYVKWPSMKVLGITIALDWFLLPLVGWFIRRLLQL